jgi:tripartite-type tricarboxylate transporter receptor subunit TctC
MIPVSRRRALGLALMAATWPAAAAENWPSRPVRLVVPFAAGGGTDATARLLAQELARQLGQPFVVENRAGAAGTVGAAHVAQSRPDGHTLLVGTQSTHGSASAIHQNLSYDPVRDFAPVSRIADVPHLLVARPTFPAASAQGLAALAREAPGNITYASAGNGASQHVSGALFEKLAGVRMVHVPFNGGGPAATALLAGQVDVMFGAASEVAPLVRSGELKTLALAAPSRSPSFPGLAAIGEVLSGYDVPAWNGILAPAGTPPDILAQLARAIAASLQVEELTARFRQLGVEPRSDTPDEFARFLTAAVATWGELVRLSGARNE